MSIIYSITMYNNNKQETKKRLRKWTVKNLGKLRTTILLRMSERQKVVFWVVLRYMQEIQYYLFWGFSNPLLFYHIEGRE